MTKIFHVSKEKLDQLKKEHEQLVAFEHVKVMGHDAPKVLESEDINPEFISYQEDMEALRFRIEELKNILEHHEIIRRPPKERQVFVNVGARVKIEALGKEDEFMIVGTLEADPDLGKISNESPVGAALLGHKVGDEIIIHSPVKTNYLIKDVKYEIS